MTARAPQVHSVGPNSVRTISVDCEGLLDEGERVLSAQQNADLIEFMGQSKTQINLTLDGAVLGSVITNLFDRGLVEARS